MIRRRASLLQLMALIASLALGLAAMKVASDRIATLVILASIMSLLAAMVGAKVGQNRADWVGYTVFGFGYLFILALLLFASRLIQNYNDEDCRWFQLDGLLTHGVSWLHPDLAVPAPLSFKVA